MANLDKFKEQARKHELKEQWPKAIDLYVKAIEALEGSSEASDSDLGLYNKVGDLYQRVGDTPNAIAYYDRAVDRHTDAGLVNQGIALCNKILRLSPGRSVAYLKLGMLFARKGFQAEAKQNLLEYADRMQKAGQIEEAFKALKKFAEMTPGQEDIWAVLAQQARASAKTPEQTEQVDKLLSEFEAKDRGAQRRSRASRSMVTGEDIPEPPGKADLIFLDIDDVPSARKSKPAMPRPPEPPPESAPLEIESTAIGSMDEPAAEMPLLDIEPGSAEPPAGLETTALGLEPTAFGGGSAAAPPDTEPAALDLEPSSLDLEPTSLDLEPTALEPESAPQDAAPEGLEPTALEPESAPQDAAPEGLGPPSLDLEPPSLDLEPAAASGTDEPAVADDLGSLDLDIGTAEEAPAASTDGLPLLDFGDEGVEVDEEGAEEEPAGEEDAGATLEFLDLGAVETHTRGPDELKAAVAESPEDWALRRQYGEALLDTGQREQGMAELDATADGFEQAGDLGSASAVIDELLRLESNSIRYQQKRVELAYRQGDKSRLVHAYVELADALLRSNDVDKAVAVYQRVVEHDPDNVRAQSALETLAPPADAAPVAAPTPPAGPAGGGDYVDLGAMLLDDDDLGGPMDTRMRIEDEEPSGDEQKDFQQMLSAFKKGIEANVGEEDFESHYDLGVAYREMGLLDEAIAEFQKALRSTAGRLKSSEALGLCFHEKGQFAVAETILRRALDLPASSDAERIGLLYWLGRTLEDQGKGTEAVVAYNRVFAVDINFQDVSARVRALAKAGA